MPAGSDDDDPTADDERVVANESAVSDGESTDDEWRFSVEDVSDQTGDDEPRPQPREDTDGNVTGSLVPDDSLEPGDIDLENAFFVALGVFVIVGLIAGAMLGL